MYSLDLPACSLVYVVTLAGHQLSTDLHVNNTGNAPFEFQALFHSYIKAPAEQVLISPLNGLKYFDKVSKETKTESRDGVDVKNFTDSVYENAPGNYKVVWPSGGIEVKTKNFKDVVVWNPRETGSSMSDMEHEGWYVYIHYTRRYILTSPLSFRLNYVCVEPGHVSGFAEVRPGDRWIGQQVLSVIDPSSPSSL
jgi:glucose-6-phosphate 1-epimerase